MSNEARIAESRIRSAAISVRRLLRRVMPGVAIAAAVLLGARLLLRDTFLFGDNTLGSFFEFISSLFIFLTIVYYGVRIFRDAKRRLLWRVRRRLTITYLFVGLTPIVLLALLGLIAAMLGAGQAMSRIVAVEMKASERQTLASARALYDTFNRLPPETDERAIQAWLNERVAQMQPTLPGARVALWRKAGSADDPALIGQNSLAQFVSTPVGEETHGIGDDAAQNTAPLPSWLQNQSEWSGLSVIPPTATTSNLYNAPAVRALVRGKANNRVVALLVTVPISRAFVRQLQESTGLNLQAFFARPHEFSASNRSRRIKEPVNKNGNESGTAKNLQVSADSSDERESDKKSSTTGSVIRFRLALPTSRSYRALHGLTARANSSSAMCLLCHRKSCASSSGRAADSAKCCAGYLS